MNSYLADFFLQLVLILDSLHLRLLNQLLFFSLNKQIARKFNSNTKPNSHRTDSSFPKADYWFANPQVLAARARVSQSPTPSPIIALALSSPQS